MCKIKKLITKFFHPENNQVAATRIYVIDSPDGINNNDLSNKSLADIFADLKLNKPIGAKLILNKCTLTIWLLQLLISRGLDQIQLTNCTITDAPLSHGLKRVLHYCKDSSHIFFQKTFDDHPIVTMTNCTLMPDDLFLHGLLKHAQEWYKPKPLHTLPADPAPDGPTPVSFALIFDNEPLQPSLYAALEDACIMTPNGTLRFSNN